MPGLFFESQSYCVGQFNGIREKSLISHIKDQSMSIKQEAKTRDVELKKDHSRIDNGHPQFIRMRKEH